FDLFHDHETGVGLGMARRQDQIAVGGGIAAGLAQHAPADVIGMIAKVHHLVEHRAAGNVEDAARDDASRFAARVGVHRGDHAGESQAFSSSLCYIAGMRILFLTLMLAALPLAAQKKAIAPPELPKSPNYSAGILSGGTLYVAGQVGQDLKTKEIP